jgi:phosphoserine phosphatase
VDRRAKLLFILAPILRQRTQRNAYDFPLTPSPQVNCTAVVPTTARNKDTSLEKNRSTTKPSKLLVLDVEGTLFETKIRLPSTTISSTIWQSIASELGADAVAEEVETHQKWYAGFYKSYLDWMKDTIRIHKKYGLSQSTFQSLISAATYSEGVDEVMHGIDRDRFEIVLVSGGFRELAVRAQKDFSIYHSFTACEYIFGPDGFLTSFNLLPCDFEGKIDFIHLMLREYGLENSDWVFVGDGTNDIPIAKSAPFSIAYGDNSGLRAVSTMAINSFRELTSILRALP